MGSFLSFDFDRTLKKQKVTMEVTFSVSGRAAAWSSRKAALCGGAGLPPGADWLPPCAAGRHSGVDRLHVAHPGQRGMLPELQLLRRD